MQVGDIVRLKKEHHLSQIFDVNCQIDEVRKFPFTKNEIRYRIKTMTGELKMTWVSESEVDKISDIRRDKLEKLGIDDN
jgi:hypothetical protein